MFTRRSRATRSRVWLYTLKSCSVSSSRRREIAAFLERATESPCYVLHHSNRVRSGAGDFVCGDLIHQDPDQYSAELHVIRPGRAGWLGEKLRIRGDAI